jgi:phage antirepressor YoqD-like protein
LLQCKKQATIALSSTKAKYIAVISIAKEVVWLTQLMKYLKLHQLQPFPFMCDNQSCIVLSKTSKNHDCTKHIDIKYHYLQEKVASLNIEFKYCPTEQMLIDVSIKTLPKPKH